jgi:hypothetical protein
MRSDIDQRATDQESLNGRVTASAVGGIVSIVPEDKSVVRRVPVTAGGVVIPKVAASTYDFRKLQSTSQGHLGGMDDAVGFSKKSGVPEAFRARPSILQTTDQEDPGGARVGDEVATRLGFCLGDMCTAIDALPHGKVFEETMDLRSQNATADEEQTQEKHARTLLLSLSQPYHGSTALECVLMSSSNVATLCSARVWQCEGGSILRREGGCADETCRWNWDKSLGLFSKYWNLSKPFLLEKTPIMVRDIPGMHQGLVSVEARYPHQRQFIMMWRPICLGALSSHRLTEEKELWMFETLVAGHKYLLEQGERVVVVNIADLMWRPSKSAWHLYKQIPDLGVLDMEYVPKIGKDIFPENMWKVDKSVAEFGRAADPDKLNYSVHEALCKDGVEGFVELSQENNARAAKALAYLRSVSPKL